MNQLARSVNFSREIPASSYENPTKLETLWKSTIETGNTRFPRCLANFKFHPAEDIEDAKHREEIAEGYETKEARTRPFQTVLRVRSNLETLKIKRTYLHLE